MKKITTLFIAIFAVLSLANAQKITLVSGEASVFKGVKQILVEYDYSNMGVGEFATESEYTDKKVAELNEKENKKGDKWLKAWIAGRKTKYQPKFEELINKYASKKGIIFSQKSKKPNYVLIVKTVYTEPGFNVYVMKKPSAVSFDFVLVEVENRSNVVAEFHLEKVPGSSAGGNDFDAASRIAESYAKAGKIFGKYIVKNLK